jgi:hypothetical protein
MHKDVFEPLTAEEESVGRRIVHAAYEVHKALGPGLMEKVYEVCFVPIMKQGIKRIPQSGMIWCPFVSSRLYGE